MTDSPSYQAFLGGSFDPFHLGHRHALQALRRARPRDRVLLVPAGLNPLKGEGPRAESSLRLEMVRRGVADLEWCGVTSVEIDRSGPSYTVETLEHLLNQGVLAPRPGMIAGDDLLQDLPRWRAFPRLLELVGFLVLQREHDAGAVRRFCRDWPSARVTAIPAPPLEVSSTEIRRRLADPELRDSAADLLPPEVYECIIQHDAYH